MKRDVERTKAASSAVRLCSGALVVQIGHNAARVDSKRRADSALVTSFCSNDATRTRKIRTHRHKSINTSTQVETVVIPPGSELLGFSTNRTGGHLARSMMLAELKILVSVLPPEASLDDFAAAIVRDNILAKPTAASREKSLRHLVQLYSLNRKLALFRVLRSFAREDASSIPLIAMTCAFCRDEQLRGSFVLIDQLRVGEILTRVRMEEHLESVFPHRFSSAMKKSLAQNVNATWTDAGHLEGRARKMRTLPQPQVLASTYAMLAGYLLGLRGEVLLSSVFARLVASDFGTLTSHLSLASARGHLRFRHAGGVIEADFAPLLSEAERRIVHGAY